MFIWTFRAISILYWIRQLQRCKSDEAKAKVQEVQSLVYVSKPRNVQLDTFRFVLYNTLYVFMHLIHLQYQTLLLSLLLPII